jgi:PAS domain S-box-containing protein
MFSSLRSLLLMTSFSFTGDKTNQQDAASPQSSNSSQTVGQRHHFAAIVEYSDDAIVSKDLNGIIQSWNKSAERIFGYPAEEAIGKSITIIIPPDRLAEEPQILSQIQKGERIDHYETVRRRKDGTLIDVSLTISPVKDESGVVIGASKIARDITEHKRAEELQRRFAAIVESSDDAIISKDLNGIIQSWNRGAEHVFGYLASEAIGKSVTILIPEGRLDEEPQILGRIRRGEKIDHYETIRRRKDGTLIDIALTVSPIRDSTGTVIGASKIARNITDRKRAEAALQAAHEELEERVKARTASLNEAMAQMQEFSYTVSHDLRGPVRAMKGYASAVLEDYGERLDNQGREYLNKIVRGSDRMEQLIRDVLIYSRLARSDIKIEVVSLDELLRDVIDQYPDLHTPNVEVIIQKPLLSVKAHPSSLAQAISNLLNNAKKFVAPGKTPRIEICTEKRSDKGRLWVKDNGIGVPPLFQSRLFGMFERMHEEDQYEGTGIGLAIVRKAVEKMGGTVGMESDGANGSSFWIELPIAANVGEAV